MSGAIDLELYFHDTDEPEWLMQPVRSRVLLTRPLKRIANRWYQELWDEGGTR